MNNPNYNTKTREKVYKWWKELIDRQDPDIEPIIIIAKQLKAEEVVILRRALTRYLES